MNTFIGLLKSKTFWVNLITGIMAIINAGSGHWIPVEVSAGIIAIINIILRFLTNKPLAKK